jgi:SAM-dependent methyltransferase
LTHIPAVLTGIARKARRGVPTALTGVARHARDRVSFGFSKVLHRQVVVERFNTLLDDAARQRYAPAVKTLWRIVPAIMRRKIPRANVQQGFMLAAVEQLAGGDRTKRMLCVGSFEDTACYALQSLGYRIDAIDPSLNVDMAAFRRQHPERLGTYEIVFSTSVIEHVPDDETFVADMVAMLAPGGHAVLTCDYNDSWTPDQPKPSTDVRIYTRADMQRLISAMGDVELLDEPDWQDHEPDFTIAEYGMDMHYGFATLAVRRR